MFYNIVTHAFKLKSVAAHQMPVGSLYNPPSFPIHGARFPLPYTPSQAALPYRVSAIFVIPTIYHQQQQEHDTQVCRCIRITSWPFQQMLKSATNAVTCSQKNFVSHHTTPWPWSSTYVDRPHAMEKALGTRLVHWL